MSEEAMTDYRELEDKARSIGSKWAPTSARRRAGPLAASHSWRAGLDKRTDVLDAPSGDSGT